MVDKTSTGCQAGAYFDNDVILPGVSRPRLQWAYSCRQFGALLDAYPDVHPEDFVTFGVLQALPRRGSQCEWGEVAGVLAHMVGHMVGVSSSQINSSPSSTGYSA